MIFITIHEWVIMFTEPTVLVLGAGSSSQYGFPLSKGLVNEIIDNLNSSDNQAIYESLGHTRSDISNFIQELRLSRDRSIDEFLFSALEDRPDDIRLGKQAIAHAILSHEIPGDMLHSKEEFWYDIFAARLKKECRFDDLPSNQISIVTFNYDRSMEYYLMESLKNKYRKTEEEMIPVLNQTISFNHIYGHLGDLPWSNSGFSIVEYDIFNNYNKKNKQLDLFVNAIENAASSIFVLPEEFDSSMHLRNVRTTINEASRIHILGFGYDEFNLKRLSSNIFTSGNKIISGTVQGIDEIRVMHINQFFGQKLTAFNGSCIEYSQKYWA